MITEQDLHEFHHRQQARDRRRVIRADERRRLAIAAEQYVYYQLCQRGYLVVPQSYGCRFDLMVEQVCRVEVKAARWTNATNARGRYQVQLHNEADVIVLCCLNGSMYPFVIPAGVCGTRENIAIWSYDPAEYGGQWAEWFGRWDVVAEAVERARAERTYQLSLMEV